MTDGADDTSASRASGGPSQPAAAEADIDDLALREVRKKAERMARARAREPQLWRHLAQVGVLGWLFILPVVGMAALGHLLHRSTGQRVYAIVGLLLGLVIGAYVVFMNVRRSLREEQDRPHEDPAHPRHPPHGGAS